MVKPLRPRAPLNLIVADFRARAKAMIALPSHAVGTCEMRVNAHQVMQLLDELDRLTQTAGRDNAMQDLPIPKPRRRRTDVLDNYAAG